MSPMYLGPLKKFNTIEIRVGERRPKKCKRESVFSTWWNPVHSLIMVDTPAYETMYGSKKYPPEWIVFNI